MSPAKKTPTEQPALTLEDAIKQLVRALGTKPSQAREIQITSRVVRLIGTDRSMRSISIERIEDEDE